MKHLITVFFLIIFFTSFSQVKNEGKSNGNTDSKGTPTKALKATFDQYRVITLENDTTYVDTSLTIKKEYEYNYLRKDIFGLLPFANEGQTYTVLDFGLKQFHSIPEIGYSSKHFNYNKVDDIKYYSVATPVTELYFKTVMEQGQSIDAFLTLNTSKRFNMSVAFKGLRSLGKYINQLSSTGNFRFTASYNTLNKRYYLNTHFTGQDFLNGENGGITTINDFESEDAAYQNRARLEVFLKDAKSFMKGKRIFFDHNFRINKTKGSNNLYLTHQFNYENKFFEYNQATVASSLDNNITVYRFGDSYVSSNVRDQVRYNRIYNKAGAIYENSLIGKFQFFAEDFRYNYYFDRILITNSGVVPSSLNDRINSVGGQYDYNKNKWQGTFVYSNSISNQSLSNFDAKLKFKLNDKNEFLFQYQMLNKIPDHIYNLHQSSFVDYNWYYNFKNEKINNLEATAKTQWFEASLQVSSLKDYLFFSNRATNIQEQIISPKQYDKTINYISIKLGREFKYWKLALDNTLLYQKVDQKEDILNVPQITTRNSLYFTDYFFKKALYLQTGFTFNYFTKFYMNDYNPVIAEAFIQNDRKLGAFPLLDFFVNARIRQTRIFLKAEHFNSKMTGNNFYTAPNYPYRDFMIRFGLVWNFFK